jgi:hypothetical protein
MRARMLISPISSAARLRPRHRPFRSAGLVAFGALLFAGCTNIGPGTVARDRYGYSDALSDSWKRQTLLNIVKLRYLDPPVFVDVGQIVAGYSLETAVSAGGQLSSASAIQGDSANLGAVARFTDRPTITYTPLTGNQFVKALMTPLPPEAVFFMIQSGWPADAVLLATAASINGLKNQETSIAGVAPPHPDFVRALTLLRNIQSSGAVSFRVVQDAQENRTSLVTFRSDDVSTETQAMGRELRELLRLDPDVREFALVFAGTAENGRELAILTRSILHIMTTIAGQVEVPPEDVEQGRATPGLVSGHDPATSYGLVRIHSSSGEPTDASVAVEYRDHWFWIDDRDLRSKRAFAFMQMLFTLSDTGAREAPPLITIPAQ